MRGGARLHTGSLSFLQNLAIGLNSTAPAYSLAAVLGALALGVGTQTPALLLVAFVPILLVALGYRALNRDEPDCGTTYPWVARAFGPRAGWFAGFLLTITGVIVIGSLADAASVYGLELAGVEEPSTGLTVGLAVLLVLAMAAVAAASIELSGRVQSALAVFQFGGLLVLAAAALSSASVTPSPSWFNPLEIPLSALPAGLAVAVFIYWGWESTTSVNEETENPHLSPGRSAVVSTLLLLTTYLLVAAAVVAALGARGSGAYEDDVAVLGDLAARTLPDGVAWIVLAAVVVSALATTQTTILPASRTALSMARRHALPRVFADVDSRTLTPIKGTLILTAISLVWYVPTRLLDEDFLSNTVTGLGLLIALYYGLTALAAAWVSRPTSTRGLLLDRILPAVGGLMMFAIFGLALPEFAADGGTPLIAGLTLLGVAALIGTLIRTPLNPPTPEGSI